MLTRVLIITGLLVAIVGLPFLLRPEEDTLAKADDTLVIVTPHNEAIRYEFTRAFSEFYRDRTGRSIRIDWRIVGGTSEIARYLASEYYTVFEREWKRAGHRWTDAVAAGFSNHRLTLPEDPTQDEEAQKARRMFLASDFGIGVDMFFGGGAYDFVQQTDAGRLVASGIVAARPDWFNESSIPQAVSGEPYYDPEGRWVGTCLSSFGIAYNTDSLKRLGVESMPAAWIDLTNPMFFQQVALADPTKSGSAAKAFEMVIQQQMQIAHDTALKEGKSEAEALEIAKSEGWVAGLRIIQAASANARYFTDAAGKVPMDVSLGDAAIGMCIDFFGRFQSEAVRVGNNESRLQYFTPHGGSSVGVDPIAMLRGGPNPKAAKLFIEFVLSEDAQKLWNFKVGTPGGPVRYALRRLPIRKELYAPEYKSFLSDPDVEPYEEAKFFTYHEEWTAPLFAPLRFIIRIICLDTHDEQVAAWKALIDAGFPPEATAKFQDLNAVNHQAALESIRPVLRSPKRIDEVILAKQLGDHFRKQYRESAELARQGK